MKNINLETPLMSTILVSVLSLFFIIACDKGSNADQTKLETDATINSQKQNPADSIDVCSLLSKSEVEQVAGKPVLEPESEQMANLFTCTYGDPEYPGVTIVVGLSVFIASNSADATEILETARKNAASVEAVGNLGEDAFWDKIIRTLWIVNGKYQIGIEAASDAGGFDTARKLAVKVLERLP